MSDPVLTYETRYQLDLTGTSSNNRVTGERHSLAQDRNRALAPLYGPFFAESVVLTEHSTGRTLIKDTHYNFVGLSGICTRQTGKDIFYIILVTDPDVLPDVDVTYQTIGGEHTYSAELLVQMVNTALVADPAASYYSLLDLPENMDPTQHLHNAGEPIGFEYVVGILERIRMAIAAGQMPAYHAAIKMITDLFGSTDARFTALLEQVFESAVTNLTNVPTLPTYPVGGTLIATYCVGTTKMGKYHNGAGGYFNAPIELNSVSCGYEPQTGFGQLITTFCDGTTQVGTYSDGNGGTYNAIVQTNSPTCGYVADNGFQATISVDNTAFNVNTARSIALSMKNLAPNTQYRVFLTALHSTGILGNFESNGAFSSDNDFNPSVYLSGTNSIAAANSAFMVVSSDANGLVNTSKAFTNRGNMATGTWVLSCEIVAVAAAAAMSVKVAQAAITVPANQPMIRLSQGSDSKTIAYTCSGFPLNTTFALHINWMNNDGNTSTGTLNFTTNASGFATGSYVNSLATLYYWVWATASTTATPDQLLSNIFSPTPSGLVGGNAPVTAPKLLTVTGKPAVCKGETTSITYVCTGLVPLRDYLNYPRVRKPDFSTNYMVDGDGQQVIQQGTADQNGVLVIESQVTWSTSYPSGAYAVFADLREMDGFTAVAVDSNQGSGFTYYNTAGPASIALRIKNAGFTLVPTSTDYFNPADIIQQFVVVPDMVQLVIAYANLIPETTYVGSITGPFGTAPISFKTKADDAVGDLDGVCGVTDVLFRWRTDAFGTNVYDTEGNNLAVKVAITSHGLSTNTLKVVGRDARADVTATPDTGRQDQLIQFATHLSNLTPFNRYRLRMYLTSDANGNVPNDYHLDVTSNSYPVGDEVLRVADANGIIDLNQDFWVDTNTGAANIAPGFWRVYIRWQTDQLAVGDNYLAVMADNDNPDQTVAISADPPYVDVTAFVTRLQQF